MRYVVVVAMLVGQARADCVTANDASKRRIEAANKTADDGGKLLDSMGLQALYLSLDSEQLGAGATPHPVGSSFERDGKTFIAGPVYALDGPGTGTLDLALDAHQHRVFVVQHASRSPHRERIEVCGCPSQAPDAQIIYGPLPAGDTFGGVQRLVHQTWELEITFACKR